MEVKNKNIIRNAKKYLKLFLKFIADNRQVIYMAFPFIVMDLATRFLGRSINFYGIYRFVPNMFSIIWIFLFLGISLSFKKKIGKWIYLSFNIIFVIFYLINNVYYSMTNNFFSFSLLESASEGSPYIFDAIFNCNILVYIFLIVIVALVFIGFKSFPSIKKNNKIQLIEIILIFIGLHLILPIFLGKANSELVWSTWKNPRNVYNQYNDSNKSMRVSGLYEYTIRGFYVSYLRSKPENADEIQLLKEIYNEGEKLVKNKFTGKFKDKNVIFLQLEGIDNWLLNKKDTPTLYNMLNNSINFTNHYSFYTGGGSTFNSEFAVNTGFIVPLSYNQNAYAFNKNDFPNSMPNLFKQSGYSVNAFHMNYGEYYSRTINYENWGFENYYGLLDLYKYTTDKYKLDREMMENEEFSNLMFPTDTKFVDYIITYSTHLPFNNTKGVCKLLYNLDNEGKEIEFKEMTEEECARRQAKETDYMVELMLAKLKEKGLLKNTIIVAFADHYLYTLEDKTILDKYKDTSSNLINKTPFFIWNNGMKKSTIKKVTSQLNILPTTLNLFGIDYNPNYYVSTDALNSSYNGLVFFNDYSWYDGNVYVEDGDVTNNKKIKIELLEIKNELVNQLARKNDLTLKYNYLKNIK